VLTCEKAAADAMKERARATFIVAFVVRYYFVNTMVVTMPLTVAAVRELTFNLAIRDLQRSHPAQNAERSTIGYVTTAGSAIGL